MKKLECNWIETRCLLNMTKIPVSEFCLQPWRRQNGIYTYQDCSGKAMGRSLWWVLCNYWQTILSNLVGFCSLAPQGEIHIKGCFPKLPSLQRSHHPDASKSPTYWPHSSWGRKLPHREGALKAKCSFLSKLGWRHFNSLGLRKITSQSFMTKLICSSFISPLPFPWFYYYWQYCKSGVKWPIHTCATLCTLPEPAGTWFP